MAEPLGVGFAAYQDGTYEVFIQNNETGEEWNFAGEYKDKKELERLGRVFADCVIVPARPLTKEGE